MSALASSKAMRVMSQATQDPPTLSTPRSGMTLGARVSPFISMARASAWRPSCQFAIDSTAQAWALAHRVADEANDTRGAIDMAYRHVLGRAATKTEIAEASVVVKERGLLNVCWALFNSTEFLYVR